MGDVTPLLPLWWTEDEDEDEGSGERTPGLDALPSLFMGFFMLRSRVPFSSTSMSISWRDRGVRTTIYW